MTLLAVVFLLSIARAAAASPCYRIGGTGQCVAGNCTPALAQVGCAPVECERDPACPQPQPKAPPTVQEAFKFVPVQPRLQVNIPTIQFSQLQVREEGQYKVLDIPWIGQLLTGIFRWAIPVGAVLAVLVIMIGGVLWMTSGAVDQIQRAKQFITNAVVGLLLLVGSYVILRTINPDLVRFPALQVRIVETRFIPSEEELDDVDGVEPGVLVTVEGDNIVTAESLLITQELNERLRTAATALAPRGITLSVTSAYRSEADQRRLIDQNCQNPPGSATCNPKPGRAATCILRNGSRSCPHTTGHAIDAWGAKNGQQCIRQANCMRTSEIKTNGWDPSGDPCRKDACQTAVINAMRGAGFCNWAGEAWHFEYPNPGFSKPCS